MDSCVYYITIVTFFQLYQAGWWFNDCYWAALNGPYVHETSGGWPLCEDGLCVAWRTVTGFESYSLRKSQMMILPNRRV